MPNFERSNDLFASLRRRASANVSQRLSADIERSTEAHTSIAASEFQDMRRPCSDRTETSAPRSTILHYSPSPAAHAGADRSVRGACPFAVMKTADRCAPLLLSTLKACSWLPSAQESPALYVVVLQSASYHSIDPEIIVTITIPG